MLLTVLVLACVWPVVTLVVIACCLSAAQGDTERSAGAGLDEREGVVRGFRLTVSGSSGSTA